MDAVKKITIGDNEYTVKMFDPMTAFEFCHSYTHARKTGASTAAIGKQAFGQCLDPMMRSLGDPTHFQTWFAQHPEDMLALESEAVNALIDPFLPNSDATRLTETP